MLVKVDFSYMPQWGSLFVENISLSAIFAPAGQPTIKIYKMALIAFYDKDYRLPRWGKYTI